MHELSLDFRPQFISCATVIIIFFPTVQIFAEAMSISHHIVSLHSGTETKPFFYYRDGKNPAVASVAFLICIRKCLVFSSNIHPSFYALRLVSLTHHS